MIELKNIEVVYTQGFEYKIKALDIKQVSINAGRWCNIIGSNGSGKSTLLKVICSSISCFTGDVLIGGKNLNNFHANQIFDVIQIVEQNPQKNLVPSMTIEENLGLYASRKGFPSLHFSSSLNKSQKSNLLARFDMGLEDRLQSQVGLLSGGQRQAIAIAGVLLRKPQILLLDEFLASIDHKTAPKLLSIVRQLVLDFNITVVMVSHNLDHILHSGDRILILSGGNIVDDINVLGQTINKSSLVKRYTSIMEKEGII